MNGMDLISTLKGVGAKTTQLFKKLDIETVADLAAFFPRGYLIYEAPAMIEDIVAGERIAVKAMINSYVTVKQVRHFKIVTCVVKDITGSLAITWFNMPFLKKVLRIGQTYVFVGTPVYKNGKLTLEHPEYYSEMEYKNLLDALWPVYPLTEGLTNKLVQKSVQQVIPYIKNLDDFLPASIIKKYHLWNYQDATLEVHFPMNKERLIEAKKRVIFDEFFLFLVSMRLMREQNKVAANHYTIIDCDICKDIIDRLPYKLTNDQEQALQDIKNDMKSPYVMNRLLQGDVGSGKTIIAMLALVMAVNAGYQGALMAPTEVLAKQHYESFIELVEPYGISIALLTGATKAAEKKEIYHQLSEQQIDIIIGTHALIQEKVEYKNLALVITDEQHRFGVRQRELFANKGYDPHVLVMSATPIPRSLAIIVYGDLDISLIKELPANRLPIKNCVVDTNYRPTAYSFIEREITKGRQAYVICPMVSESETIEAENVMEYTEKLRDNLPAFVNVESLNGKMKPQDKNDIMERFANREIDVLVSTTVIEVGINVPNATVMMVENAERFGLAQLHQLRGRVGRGKHQSYCIFVSGSKSKETKERLEILNKSNDGFFIANEDLRLRGPGDFFGIRQSGMMDFTFADIYSNANILQMANEAIDIMLTEGYALNDIKNPKLTKQISKALNI